MCPFARGREAGFARASHQAGRACGAWCRHGRGQALHLHIGLGANSVDGLADVLPALVLAHVSPVSSRRISEYSSRAWWSAMEWIMSQPFRFGMGVRLFFFTSSRPPRTTRSQRNATRTVRRSMQVNRFTPRCTRLRWVVETDCPTTNAMCAGRTCAVGAAGPPGTPAIPRSDASGGGRPISGHAKPDSCAVRKRAASCLPPCATPSRP